MLLLRIVTLYLRVEGIEKLSKIFLAFLTFFKKLKCILKFDSEVKEIYSIAFS